MTAYIVTRIALVTSFAFVVGGVVAALLSPPLHAGKPDRRIKMNVMFNNSFPGARVTSDGLQYSHDPAGDLEVFLFGSGNLGLRMGDPNFRLLNLDFNFEGSGAQILLDALDCVNGDCLQSVVVSELNNNALQLPNDDCSEAEGAGLLCIPPGESRASGFVIHWNDEATNQHFRVLWRDDRYWDVGANEVRIARCSSDPMGPECDATRLAELGVPVGTIVDPTHIWIFSTVWSSLPGCYPDEASEQCTTGPYAWVSSQMISRTKKGKGEKGKPVTTDLGSFPIPFELVAWCEEDESGNCTS